MRGGRGGKGERNKWDPEFLRRKGVGYKVKSNYVGVRRDPSDDLVQPPHVIYMSKSRLKETKHLPKVHSQWL